MDFALNVCLAMGLKDNFHGFATLLMLIGQFATRLWITI